MNEILTEMTNQTIYFISDTYPPLGRAGSMIRADFSNYLSLEGWKVKVITIKNPSGMFIKYLKDESLHENVKDHVEIYPVETFNWWFLGEVLFVLGIIPCPLINWALTVIRRLPSLIKEKGIIFATFPSVSNLIIGYFAKKRYNYPLALDFRDEYYDVDALHRTYVGRKLTFKYERILTKNADIIFVATEKIRENLINRHRLNKSRVHVIYNGYSDEIETREKENRGDKMKIVYAGAIAQPQKPEVLNFAYRKLMKTHPELRGKIEIDVYGPVNYYFERFYQKSMTDGIKYKGFIPHVDLMKKIRADIDIGFFSLADVTYSYATPTKLFEYINLELPMLAALPDGEARRIIEQYDLGKVSHYSDINSLADNIYQYYTDVKERERVTANIRKIKSQFHIKLQVKKMSDALKALEG